MRPRHVMKIQGRHHKPVFNTRPGNDQMREIIYVQAGTTANYVGTHFWNSQDYYATLDVEGDVEADEHERIDHEKSFSIREDVGAVRMMMSLEALRPARDGSSSVQILSDRDYCCLRERVRSRQIP